MKTSEKKLLFTAISEEDSASVCGGFISIAINIPLIYSDPDSVLDAAKNYGIDVNKIQQDLIYLNSGADQ